MCSTSGTTGTLPRRTTRTKNTESTDERLPMRAFLEDREGSMKRVVSLLLSLCLTAGLLTAVGVPHTGKLLQNAVHGTVDGEWLCGQMPAYRQYLS